MKILNKLNLDLLFKINYVFFITLGIFTVVKHSALMTGFWVMFLGIIGSYLIYKNNPIGYIFYAIQSINYASIAIRFSLVGEFYSHLILVSGVNILFLIKVLDSRFDTSNYIEYYMNFIPKAKSITYRIIKYLFLIIIYFAVNFTLTEMGSLFPDLEAVNIILIICASSKLYRNSSEQWLFWFAKGIISVVIWLYIEDRLFILEYYVFDFIYALLTILNLRKTITYEDDNNGK